MLQCRANSSSGEREKEGENDRLTGSIMMVAICSCHGYWSMRINQWNKAQEKEEKKKNIRVENCFVFSPLCRFFSPLTFIGRTVGVLVS